MISFNLHINYNCPLKCRYCVQRENPELLKIQMPLEDMIERVQNFLNYCNADRCNVNISGGEPLLRYHDIQKLMEHFPHNSWEISTSGYLLDKEKARYFSQFNVHYVLSIDGTERVTNYLRPLANGTPGYFKQLKENIPHILYYAPKTRAKLIVPKRFISEVYNTYIELEQLGFNEIFITPNVYENTIDDQHPELSTGIWEENDWMDYAEQIQLITNEIKQGIINNTKRCLISNVKFVLFKMLFPDKEFNEINKAKIICPVLDFKGGSSPVEGQIGFELLPISLCVHDNPYHILNQEDFIQRAQNDFKQLTGTCPRDINCNFQKSCVYSICLSESIKSQDFENIWIPSNFACLTQKIYHYAALDLINILNQCNNEISKYYFLEIYKLHREVEKKNEPTTLLSSCEYC